MLIILISCIAVFYILRNHPIPDVEQPTSRRQRGRYQHTPAALSLYTYNPSSTITPPTWSQKLSNAFRIGSKRGGLGRAKPKRERGGGHGWVQAGSGDEWDSEFGNDEGRRRHSGHIVTPTIKDDFTKFTPPTSRPDSPFRPPPAGTSDSSYEMSNSTVRFDLVQSVPQLPYRDPRSGPSQSSSGVLPPAFQPIPPRTASPEPLAGTSGDTGSGRPFSTHAQSDRSMRTLGGGTKFIESI